MTETHASFTGSIPENYHTYLGPLLFEFSAADMARRVKAVLDGPAKVLEIACGTGISTRHLATALPDGAQLVATDLNQAMLDHAQTFNGALPGVTFEAADALDLPFEDERFDAVVCSFGLMFFPDKAKGMAEMTRVLKPGGTLALNVWSSFEKNPVVGVVDRAIKRFFESDPPRFLEVPFSLHDTDKVRGLFRGAGYEAVEVARVRDSKTSEYGNIARGFVTGNPTIIEIEQRADVDAEDVIAAVIAELERELGPPPGEIALEEIVYLGRKPT